MSAERFTLDTNILVTSIDAREAAKRQTAARVVEKAVRLDCPLALQAVGEFYIAATTKLKLEAKDAARRAELLIASFETFVHSKTAVQAAMNEASKGRFSFWDGLLLASAAEAGCTHILSEDMADGARFGSVVVVNPFAGKDISGPAKALLAM
jgi:predicted nucleic acid-binding protein